MTEADVDYVLRLVEAGIIEGPVLELGAGYGGQTCRTIIESANLRYLATDVAPSAGVDFVADFSSRDSIAKAFSSTDRFGTILILNVLEHTFDPVSILDNACRLLADRGTMVVVTPAIWPIHNFPIDCYRLLPDFYVQYAASRGMVIDRKHFEYVGRGPIDENVDSDGTLRFPFPVDDGFGRWKSRIVHRLFNTYARGMTFPAHVAIGAVLSRK